ncbi:hypothetical protein [Mycolicibacterium sp. 050158]|uniref:hypothetical protein n=1 Tax=Mycolicibacterium sp. 050158 TaxID=3090602 RepID=UPI00299D1B5A|nr:hypothetical protein [Mycolicibacterium sp. 050158]MDX1890849.1 hypothetical protein [Mycolicibacterium sp. 050158]
MTVLESPIPRFHLAVPIDDLAAARHFYGTVLGLAQGRSADDTAFVIEPYLRFESQTGEQWTMFLLDPAGNALEFEAFVDDSQVFATEGDR